MDGDLEGRLRAAAFAYLDEITRRSGGPVTRAQLEAFTFERHRLPLITRQRGIWKPAQLQAALSILTTYSRTPEARPYEDEPGPDGFPRYKWRGTEPHAYENVALRYAMQTQTPLIWFLGLAPGIFEAHYPIWIAGEEPERQQFVLALEEELLNWTPDLSGLPFAPVRRYAEHVVRTRLHQPVFRAGSCWRTSGGVHSAISATPSSSTPPTSGGTHKAASRSSPTGSPCAPSTTRRSTSICWASTRSSASRSARTS